MLNYSRSIIEIINALSEKKRLFFTVSLDFLLVCLSFVAVLSIFSFSFSYGALTDYSPFILGLLAFVMLPILFVFKIYQFFFRYPNSNLVGRIFLAVLVSFCFQILVLFLFHWDSIWYAIASFHSMMVFFLVVCSRVLLDKINQHATVEGKTEHLLIYGAGKAGAQLASALTLNKQHRIMGFVDDASKKQGRRLFGIKIYSPERLAWLVKSKSIQKVLLAVPSANIYSRKKIIDRLVTLNIKCTTVPKFEDLVSGKFNFSDVVDIGTEEILQRPPRAVAGGRSVLQGKVVMVTGAGGSIGSEICLQVLTKGIAKLVLVESSEINLYNLEKKLSDVLMETKNKTEIVPLMLDLKNTRAVAKAFENHKPQILFHAAAYKHVHLCEQNIISAVENNYFVTEKLVELSVQHQLNRFVMISTDKAVRSTNVMGATKRMAEILLRLKARNAGHTRLSVVRFGNVIGSSGSAIPLFEKQISQGGPVTVTDPDASRYFMSISEAVALVLKSADIAKGGEIFVLDMGEPVKIIEVVKKMIALSGKTVKSRKNPDGDLEIQYIGLRSGEKMFEELNFDGVLKKTAHPEIRVADESSPDSADFFGFRDAIKRAVSDQDASRVKQFLLAKGLLIDYESPKVGVSSE